MFREKRVLTFKVLVDIETIRSSEEIILSWLGEGVYQRGLIAILGCNASGYCYANNNLFESATNAMFLIFSANLQHVESSDSGPIGVS